MHRSTMKTNGKVINASVPSFCLVYPILTMGLFSHVGMAQSTGTFTATEPMIIPRTGHTATLLLNGKVLVAGGRSNEGPDVPALANAELYDPSTGTFAATGNLTEGRLLHTATLLSDGRVLIAGGLTLSAETYDPSTGVFTTTGDMAAHPYPWPKQAPLLQDGRVFIAGYPTGQLYDPITGSFTPTGPYAAAPPAILQGVTLLADGRVLLTGAVNICYQPLCRDPGAPWVEIFDPLSGTFAPVNGMKWWNTVYTATLLTSGKVLFAGTDTYNGIPSATEIFDPADATFSAIDRPSPSPSYSSATLLPDGTVLITGDLLTGAPIVGDVPTVSQLYTPENSTFLIVSGLPAGSIGTGGTSTLLPDGTVLIAGPSNVELFHPSVLVGAPKLFPAVAGSSEAAVWHTATGRLVSLADPAVAGEVLSMYTSGLRDGSVIPPQVAIGGRLAEIRFFGPAPGYPGFEQVNLRLPAGIVPGPTVPLRLIYLGRSSNEVRTAVQ